MVERLADKFLSEGVTGEMDGIYVIYRDLQGNRVRVPVTIALATLTIINLRRKFENSGGKVVDW